MTARFGNQIIVIFFSVKSDYQALSNGLVCVPPSEYDGLVFSHYENVMLFKGCCLFLASLA